MKIGIIALGWLGESLYDFWEKKYQVVGTYFHHPKNKTHEIFYNWTSQDIPNEIQNCDLIVLNLTPTTIQNETNLSLFLQKIKARIVFISSTSVYGDQGVVNEHTNPNPSDHSGKLLLACEKLVLNHRKDNIVIRPAGLYGKNRHPGKFLAGKKLNYNGLSALNLIGLSDLINIIDQAILQKSINVINAVNLNHPTKRDYYNDFCQRNLLEIPYWSQNSHEDKTITTLYPQFQISSELP
jgi:hypothetical protein